MAFRPAVNAFLGQNYGAKRYDRVRRGYFCAIAMTAAWGLCTTFLADRNGASAVLDLFAGRRGHGDRVNYLRIVD